MSRRRFGHRAAFTLFEMLVALGVSTVLFGVAGELFNANFKVIGKSEVLSRQTAQIDSALFRLRHDVWSASQITVPTPRSVSLVNPDGGKVSWVVTADGSVQRTDADGHTMTWPIGIPLMFSTDHFALSVSSPDAQGAKSVRLVSQFLLARGATP